MATKTFRTGIDYANSRVGKRGERDMDNRYEHDAIAMAFEAGRDSRQNAVEVLAVLSAKLDMCRDGDNFGSGITNGNVWMAHNAICIDEGRTPDAPNKHSPALVK